MHPKFQPHNAYSHRGLTIWAQNTKKRQYEILSFNVIEENTIEIVFDGTLHGKLSGCFNIVWRVDDFANLATPLRATVSCPLVTQKGILHSNVNVKVVKELTEKFTRYCSGGNKFRFPTEPSNQNGDLITATLEFASDPVILFIFKFKKLPKKPSNAKRKEPDYDTDDDEDTIYVRKTPRLNASSGARIIDPSAGGPGPSTSNNATTRGSVSERNGSPTIEDLCEGNLREAQKLQEQKDSLKGSLEELRRQNETIDLVKSKVARLLK